MKKTYVILGFMLFSIGSYCASNPIFDFIIFNNEKVEITISNNTVDNNRISANLYKNVFSFKTKDEIKYIQVFNEDNKLLYQLPILSKKVEISKALFKEGEFKLIFFFHNNESPLTTLIAMKN